MSYPVGRVAELAGVTVRALHHYDEIGLLSPSGRTGAGYRRYDDADLDRLQQILYYRELGFPLEEIAALLDDPDTDPAEHLKRQHGLLTGRLKRLQEMVAAVEYAMEARKMGIDLTPEEKFEVFGEHDPDRYADEARERWGDTDAYAESTRRTSRYGKEDWQRQQAVQAVWNGKITAVMRAGLPADSVEAMELAEEHRVLISEWFYECSYEIQTGLADMYLADERFTAHYEDIAPGLAQYLHDAIHANAVARS